MDTVIYNGNGCYRVVWAKDRRIVKLCKRLLCGLPVNHRTGRYRYVLFFYGRRFVMRRKDLSNSAWDQPWIDVCVVERVS